MNKAELEEQVRSLETSLKTFEGLQKELTSTKERLESINKPIITDTIVEQIRRVVYTSLNNYDLDDVRNFEYEFEIDYNNQLTLNNLSFGDTDELEEQICGNIEDLFNIVEDIKEVK
jgi:hypothetical protein